MKRILAIACIAIIAAGCTTRTATLPDGRVIYKSARFATDEKMKRVEFRSAGGDVFVMEGYSGNQTDAIGIAVEAAVKGALAGSTGGASAVRSGPPVVPPGYKLVPVDDPSEPKPEIEIGGRKVPIILTPGTTSLPMTSLEDALGQGAYLHDQGMGKYPGQ